MTKVSILQARKYIPVMINLPHFAVVLNLSMRMEGRYRYMELDELNNEESHDCIKSSNKYFIWTNLFILSLHD